MRIVVGAVILGWSRGMISGYNDPSPVFPRLKLHGMTGRVGIGSPVFRKIIRRVYLRLKWAMDLCGDIYRIAPCMAGIGRCFIPHLFVSFAFSYFTLMIIPGIVKKKTAGLYLTRLEEIGLMKSIKIGKEKMYIHRQLYEVLKK